MKKFFTLLVLCSVFFSFRVLQSLDDVVGAIKSGSSSQVSRFFDNTIEISLPDKTNSYSKSQAELVLKDFFANNPVKSFALIHKGGDGGSQYCIGNLLTKNGNYRTTIYMKQKGDKQFLQEIRFEN